MRVTKLAQESTLAKIIAFVEEAREQKSETQRFTDRFEGQLRDRGHGRLGAGLPDSRGSLLGHDSDDSFYRAMTLLVVASPCALVISTPASTLSGLANAARNGILFKGGNHLENAGAIKTVAFDKTGTLTDGQTAPDRCGSARPGDGWNGTVAAWLPARSASRSTRWRRRS